MAMKRLIHWLSVALALLASAGPLRAQERTGAGSIHVAQNDAAKRLDEKLKNLTQEEIDGCKEKLAGLSAPGFTLRCDKLVPFGALLGSVPVSQTATSLADCAARCRNVPKCVAFSFDAGARSGNHSCYLTGSISRYNNAKNWIAGTR